MPAGYDIKMLADAFDPIQAAPDAGDLKLIADGVAGYGIVSSVLAGCLVSPSTPAAMSVFLGNGMVQNGTTRGVVGGGTVPINPASSQPRIDLISINTGTFAVYTQGVPAANPVWPVKPANTTVVAAVLVRPDTTAITGNNIIQKQVMLPWQPRGIYQDHGNCGATETLDFGLADVHRCVLDANCTFSFAGAISGIPASMMVHFIQDATGGRVFTFPGSVRIPEPGFYLANGPNERSRAVFMTEDGGTNIDIAVIGNAYA